MTSSISQQSASNINHSIIVSASAGTGKTKTLVDRIILLMLNETDPTKILCITFTNAAVSEMQRRIGLKLKQFHTCSEEELNQELSSIIGHQPSRSILDKARTLFNIYLSSADSLKIHTIHAFCQYMLRIFPLEVGINPNFSVKEITSEDVNDVYNILLKQSPDVIKNISYLTQFCDVKDLIEEIIHLSPYLEYINRFDEKIIDVSPKIKYLFQHIDRLGRALDDVDSNNLEQFRIIKELKSDITLDNMKALFINKDGSPKAVILNKKTKSQWPKDVYELLKEIQSFVIQIRDDEKTNNISKAHFNLKQVASAVISIYEDKKLKLGYLDYNDLILYARKLLTNSSFKEWVLYKIDSTIEHILIDEAQDTSRLQWQIIDAIIAEFFSGFGINTNRTIFIVGDDKQSIYGFQGADLEYFYHYKEYLQTKIENSRQICEDVVLQNNYRSSKPILDLVEHIFDRNFNIDNYAQSKAAVNAMRESFGRVEFFKMKTLDRKQLPWEASKEEDLSKKNLASKIVGHIQNIINSNIRLPSTNDKVNASDFMVLVKKRDSLIRYIVEGLNIIGIPYAGSDRLKIKDNPSVSILLCIMRFIIQPFDNLNLIKLLLSPIINLSQESIYSICLNRQEPILEYVMQNHKDVVDILDKISHMYSLYPLPNLVKALIDNFRFSIINNKEDLDATNTLLKISYQYYCDRKIDLLSFIEFVETGDVEVKRDVFSLDGVRITTVHGAKGLESPIVIIADNFTNQAPRSILLSCQSKTTLNFPNRNSNKTLLDIKSSKKDFDYKEYLRLLYVGMTRAMDILCFFSYEAGSNSPHYQKEKAWQVLTYNYIASVGSTQNYEDYDYSSYSNGEFDIVSGSMYKNDNCETSLMQVKNIEPINNLNIDSLGHRNALIDYLLATTDKNQYGTYKDITQLVVLYKLSLDGKMMHRYLEYYMNQEDLGINNVDLIEPVIKNETMRQILDCGVVMTELGFIHEGKIGRIDLLVVKDKDVYIIDYKLSRHENDYSSQMTFYYSAISAIYYGKTVHVYIASILDGKLTNININNGKN